MASDGCPEPSDLHQYIDRSHDSRADDEIAAHVATCARCRRVLEEATDRADGELWRDLWAARGESLNVSGTDTLVLDREHESDIPPNSLQVDGFEILGVLGRGGSGVVYKARQLKLGRLVALKMLLAGAHAPRKAIARLRCESATIARLQHPQIVAIYDIGEHQGIPYLCLELVEGRSLADWMGGKPMPPGEAARVTASLARVVQVAHARGIIHRDLKPANVLVADAGDGPFDPSQLKLADFGLARRLDADAQARATLSGVVLGTPSYMAPEQATAGSKGCGPAVDIYGLGAIFYELLTGRPPFLGGSPVETVFQVVGRKPEPPSRINARVPESLEAICLRCLEKDPARRYSSAAALADELDRSAFDPRTSTARWWPRLRWRRRFGVLTAVAASLLATAIASFFVSQRGSPTAAEESASPNSRIALTVPPSRLYSLDGPYLDRGRVEITPAIEDANAIRTTKSFDLSDNRHRQFLVESLTRNAVLWEEKRHGIRYWGPIDGRKWFEVVYRFRFDHAVRAAALYASLYVIETDSQGVLEISTDPARGWKTVATGATAYPNRRADRHRRAGPRRACDLGAGPAEGA
jgi:serine/threonine protein kinase